MLKPHKAILILEDKTTYHGWSYISSTQSIGEIVFNTGMTGYQEIMYDPSYYGQIVVFTYPELGNTGINPVDKEANIISLKGLIAKEICIQPSNWRTHKSLIEYLQINNIPHIYGIDTRSLAKHLRKVGTMNGCISTDIANVKNLISNMLESPSMKGQDLVQYVSTKNTYLWNNSLVSLSDISYQPTNKNKSFPHNLTILIVDFGCKYSILRNLSKYAKYLIVVSANTNIQNILTYQPDGILLSNGPGDPQAIEYGITLIQNLLTYKIPIFGICMGHQLLNLAAGMKSYKLKFGHRGLNHPAGNTKKIEITSQNHGFTIQDTSLPKDKILLTHINLNDETVAGISYKTYPYFSVQYHPEASPGPHDTEYLFLHFIRIVQMIKNNPNLII